METRTGGASTRMCAPTNSRVRAYELASRMLACVTLPVICTVGCSCYKRSSTFDRLETVIWYAYHASIIKISYRFFEERSHRRTTVERKWNMNFFIGAYCRYGVVCESGKQNCEKMTNCLLEMLVGCLWPDLYR